MKTITNGDLTFFEFQVRHRLIDKGLTQVSDEVLDQVQIQFVFQVQTQVLDQVRNQVWAQVRENSFNEDDNQ
jgi:hypothetical protein